MKKILYLTCFLLLFSLVLKGQDSEVAEQFTMNNPFKMKLYADFQQFADQLDTPKYIPAKIHYQDEQGMNQTKKVKVKARGVFRRETCAIPPIRINFNAKNYEVDEFDQFGSMKLVNECDFGNKYQEYLVKEYLVYKMYEYLTDYSFKTWFMQIEFINSKDTTDRFTSYAFLIEDIDDLAARFGMVELEKEGLKHADLDDSSESIAMLFNYMISNSDVFVDNLHNLKLIQKSDSSNKPIVIPYDFDFSGFVDADYAFSSESIPGKSVRDRYYIGECRTNEEYKDLFKLFIDMKSQMLSNIENCTVLSDVSRSDAIEFLDGFFNIIENPRKAKKKITNKCW